MRRTALAWIGCLTVAGVLLGCGGGGSREAGPAWPRSTDYAGSWFGVQQPDVGPTQTFGFDSASNQIDDVRIDGVLQPQTGNFDTWSGYVFGWFVAPPLREAMVWFDPTVTRMGFVDTEATLAVLEKGTTTLPAGGYGDADLRGARFAGLTTVWPTGGIYEGIAGTGAVDVASDGTFSGSIGGTSFTNAVGSTLDCNDTAHGTFFSHVTRQGHGPSHVELILGPSKDFIVGMVALTGGTFPDDYVFFGWTRQ